MYKMWYHTTYKILLRFKNKIYIYIGEKDLHLFYLFFYKKEKFSWETRGLRRTQWKEAKYEKVLVSKKKESGNMWYYDSRDLGLQLDNVHFSQLLSPERPPLTPLLVHTSPSIPIKFLRFLGHLLVLIFISLVTLLLYSVLLHPILAIEYICVHACVFFFFFFCCLDGIDISVMQWFSWFLLSWYCVVYWKWWLVMHFECFRLLFLHGVVWVSVLVTGFAVEHVNDCFRMWGLWFFCSMVYVCWEIRSKGEMCFVVDHYDPNWVCLKLFIKSHRPLFFFLFNIVLSLVPRSNWFMT